MTLPALGAYPLEAWHVAVEEKQRYEHGRWQRRIMLRGAADTFASTALLDEALDALTGAALAPEPVLLRLRPGRAVPVRLRACDRRRHETAVAGAFVLELEGLAPWEESDALRLHEAPVVQSGVVCEIENAGSLATPLSLRFTASGLTLLPAFSDGARVIAYAGILHHGDVLDIDSDARKAYRNGADVADQVSGAFLMAAPGATDVSFAADPEGAQTGALELRWKERWL